MPQRPAVLVLVAAQVAVPLTMLVARWSDEGVRPVTERPASFQMYSSTEVPAYTGVRADGSSSALTVDGLPPVLRAVGTGTVVPRALCARDRSLVLVRRAGGPDPREVRC